MRATKALLMSVLAALAGVACNPSDFNSLLDEAPVVSYSPEGASTGSLFVLPLPPPVESGTTAAARMLVSRKDDDFLGIADFDLNGKVRVHEANDEDKATWRNSSVYSAAMGSDGTVFVGMPRYGGGDIPPGKVGFVSPTPDGVGGYSFGFQGGPQGGNTTRLGISVAVGNVTGSPAGSDFVALGDTSVLLLDRQGKLLAETKSCATVSLANAAEFYAFRPVAVGDLLLGGLDEIVIAGQGRVMFLRYEGTDTLSCPIPAKSLTSQSIAASPLVGFGSSLAVGDFNADERQDLAVGAPPFSVYVFFGPLDLDNLAAASFVQIKSSTGSFGERIASYHVPGAPAAQLLVGDRSGTASGGPEGGGRVLLFNVRGDVPELTDNDAVVTLFDASSDSGQQEFGGTNLGGLLFNTGLCVPGGGITMLPWASTNLDVLTFFNYKNAMGAPSDPRCFALAR